MQSSSLLQPLTGRLISDTDGGSGDDAVGGREGEREGWRQRQ